MKKVEGYRNYCYICIEKMTLIMNNADFWASINAIIDNGFSPEGLRQLD